jgi:hypothetical protein
MWSRPPFSPLDRFCPRQWMRRAGFGMSVRIAGDVLLSRWPLTMQSIAAWLKARIMSMSDRWPRAVEYLIRVLGLKNA